MNFSFGKEERLCSRRLIESLYSDGHRLMAFPYSVQWRLEPLAVPCQVLVVAPKRKFRHAVDRNRIKRLTRECWRLRKHTLYQYLAERNLSITLALVYVHNEEFACEPLGRKMDKLVEALMADIEKYRQP